MAKKKMADEVQPKELLTVLEVAERLDIATKIARKNAASYGALKMIDKTPWIDWQRYVDGATRTPEVAPIKVKRKAADPMEMMIGRLRGDLGLISPEKSKRSRLTIPEAIEDLERGLKVAQNNLRLSETSREKVVAMKEVAQVEAKLEKKRAEFKEKSAKLDVLLADPRWDAELQKVSGSSTD